MIPANPPRPTLYFSDVETHLACEVSGVREAALMHRYETAGGDWWLVAAWTARDAFEQADLLFLGLHPRQADYDAFHADIRHGLDPNPATLYPPDEIPTLPRAGADRLDSLAFMTEDTDPDDENPDRTETEVGAAEDGRLRA